LRNLIPAALAAVTACSVCLAAADGSSFTGVWNFNPQESDVRDLPDPPAATLRLELTGGILRVTAGNETAAVSYATDRTETKSSRAGRRMSTIAKWEGVALLLNTLVSGADHYTQMDRWTVTRNGARLTIRRQIVRRASEVESTLVYDRLMEEKPALAATAVETLSVRPAAPPPKPRRFSVSSGTKIPLRMVNSLSTKQAAEGDRLYLETIFPIVSEGHVVVPPGSYVAGSVTRAKRPGRIKGKGELFIRFDSLTLPNGVTRDFRARPGAVDGELAGEFERDEGKIKSEGNKGGDARSVGEATAAGASVGGIAGSVAGRGGMGVGVGAAAGAAAGLAGVLLSRGPDAVLPRGSTLDMVLDRDLHYTEEEIDFSKVR
jgi:type IV secretion system protein VirB10